MPITSGSAPVARKSLRESAAEQIRAAILDGTLKPGENLNDGELQEWLGISRTPVRDALNDLARYGLIEMAPQRYTRVAKPRPEDRTQIMQTLGALVGGVVRVTVAELTDTQRAELITSVQAAAETLPTRDYDAHGTLGWDMVHLFLKYCPNRILVAATQDRIDGLGYQLTITRNVESTDWAALEAGYPALITALQAGDSIAAELAIETVFQLPLPTA
ncbi:GntR family transcriptional regulator [Mycetocola lacteus]|uniref:GntR family transcriptional regulator n=1 Tax=Mycetocola lacteus TaxID=76637 RepID=A0A3L7AXV0_9MICO|nr:GntR family transcriptional regulator [Mycetocola lacteus]RLP80653.1 GntR family transcriptional regulator [Mycetocola lacteus]RLP84438.1 GntR family transcriptional regulator [Mycetocola lacteus]